MIVLFNVPVMVTVVFELTPDVVTVNVPVVAPAGTVAVDGTVAFVLFELKLTVTPEEPAGPVRVMVPVVDVPPTTADGLNVIVEMPGGLIVRLAVWLVPLSVPVMVARVREVTAVVVMGKLAEFAPAGTVTVAWTVALLELDVRVTTVLGPAGPAKVTVVSPAGVIVRVADCVVPLSVPAIVTGVLVETPVVVIGNVAVLVPAPTTTVAWTVAELLFDERLTVSPPVGALLLKVTVPVEDVPPTTEDGETVTLVNVGAVIVRVAV